MSRKWFGTDGVRGHVGVEPITPDFVMRLGYSAGKVLAKTTGTGRPSVLIGKDTRISGYLLEAALEAGFAAAGVDVTMTGPLPTPAVAYLTRALRMSAGVVISASHNPFEDNGIKFFSAMGTKLPDQIEAQIEAGMNDAMGCVKSEQLGKVRRLGDAGGRYIEFCKSTFPANLNLHGLKIVVDCAHGAAYETGPAVFHELGADVIRTGASPTGININLDCGATHPEALQQAVKVHGADIGIALDGDADRLIMVDRSGRIFNGDELLYVMVKSRMIEQKVCGAVGTLMSNLGLEQAFGRSGVGFARAKVGDRYVLEVMQEKGWLYGGESSGHLLALDCHSTGDGTISALQILRAIKQQNKPLAELTSDLHMFPQTLINVRIAKDLDWKNNAKLQAAQKSVEAELGQDGRVLVRASGTEPLLRFMVEAKDESVAKTMAQRLADSVAA
jgi:phosphoglucosamine mutase